MRKKYNDRLRCSQKAHKRLTDRALRKGDAVLASYHAQVMAEQRDQSRMLLPSEKKAAFDFASSVGYKFMK